VAADLEIVRHDRRGSNGRVQAFDPLGAPGSVQRSEEQFADGDKSPAGDIEKSDSLSLNLVPLKGSEAMAVQQEREDICVERDDVCFAARQTRSRAA
jgi:hypothetical protein